MSIDSRIRMPIKDGQFKNNDSFKISEVPLKADFSDSDSCPQAMRIEFEPEDETTGAEINLIWGGKLYFKASTSTPDNDLPKDISDVTPTSFKSWNLKGTLNIEGVDSNAFKENNILRILPNSVRYEFVKLTSKFIFETIVSIKNMKFKLNDQEIEVKNGFEKNNIIDWKKKLIFGFIHGDIPIEIKNNNVLSADDFTEMKMPVVAKNDSGKYILELIMSSVSPYELNNDEWYSTKEIDRAGFSDSFDLEIVPKSLKGEYHQRHNPRHPSHSIIPAIFIFYIINDDFIFNKEGSFYELFVNFLLLDHQVEYKRIDLLRPHFPDIKNSDDVINDNPFSNEHRRQYPLHSVEFNDKKSGKSSYFRIPINGIVYKYFNADSDDVTISIKIRNNTSNVGSITISAPNEKNSRILMGYANNEATLKVVSSNIFTLYLNCIKFDSLRTLHNFKKSIKNKKVKKVSVSKSYNLRSSDIKTWCISSSKKYEKYCLLYGHIRESAARHKITPEFLQATFFGEGSYCFVSPCKDFGFFNYNKDQILSSGSHLGTDTIADNHPDYPITTLDFPDIGYQFLVENHYIDKDIIPSSIIINIKKVPNYNLEAQNRNHYLGDIIGWEHSIELVAAELNARLQMMIDPLLDISNSSELSVPKRNINSIPQKLQSYLSYYRFNAILEGHKSNWKLIAIELNSPSLDNKYLNVNNKLFWTLLPFGKGIDGYPDEKKGKLVDKTVYPIDRIHFKSLRRVAIADWFSRMGCYR